MKKLNKELNSGGPGIISGTLAPEPVLLTIKHNETCGLSRRSMSVETPGCRQHKREVSTAWRQEEREDIDNQFVSVCTSFIFFKFENFTKSLSSEMGRERGEEGV